MAVFYDITLELGTTTPVWDGDFPVEIETISSRESGQAYHISRFTLLTHSGTHVDAPFHFLENGKSLTEFSIESFFLPVQVVEYHGRNHINAAFVRSLNLKQSKGVLFKTSNSAFLQKGRPFTTDFIALNEEAAKELAQMELQLIGIDYLSIEPYRSEGYPVHKALLGADMLILEGAQLADVPEGHYQLVCLPLKIDAPDGAPVRAILIRDW